MFDTLAMLALASKLVGAPALGVAVEARAKAAHVAAESALALEGLEGEELAAWSRRLWGWSYWESAWHPSPPGSNDNGAACGIMQVHFPERLLAGATCDAVRKDAVLGYRVGYRLLKELVAKCGSLDAALGAYATGQCRPKMQLVRWRCQRLSDKC